MKQILLSTTIYMPIAILTVKTLSLLAYKIAIISTEETVEMIPLTHVIYPGETKFLAY